MNDGAKQWTVYMHTCPNNKKYIGITSKNVEDRWKNGSGYNGQYFDKAIKEFGWDNIEHEIIATNLTEEEAYEVEEKFIKLHNTLFAKHGYNLKYGKRKRKCKEVRVIDLNLVFSDTEMCAKYFDVARSSIASACKDGRKHYGHYFEYVAEGLETDIVVY